MFIKNKKFYLISLLISVIGTILFWVFGFINNDIVATILGIVLFLAAVAGVACGSLGVYVSLVKASFRKSNFVVLSLPGIIIHFALKILLIAWAITLGLICCFAFPGVYAIIAWFRNKDYLVE